MCSKLTWSHFISQHVISQHGGSELCKELLLLKELLFFMNNGGKYWLQILDYSDAELDIQDMKEHSRLYLSLFSVFRQENNA